MPSFALHLLVVLTICCSIVCRARHMDATTKWPVKWQHALLCIGALYSLVVPYEWSPVIMGGGVAAFLLLGASRWRFDAPSGTARSMRSPWAKP